MLIKILLLPLHGTCMYMYNCIYSQSISYRRLLSLFSLSNCINVLFDTKFYQKASLVVNPVTVDSYTMLSSVIARRRVGPQTQLWPQHKASIRGLGRDDLSLALPAMVQLVVFFNSGWQCL